MKLTKKKLLVAFESLIALILLGSALYLSDGYSADREAITAFQTDQTVTKQVLSDKTIAYVPENAEHAVIFYPGGKVDYSAYEPLMWSLSEHQIATFIVKMPFNLAVLNTNAANGIQEKYPDIQHWYMSGHSLGGTIAASYLSQHVDDYDGLILLASYAIDDLSQTNLKVLSITGSEDCVLNMEKAQENTINLPESFNEVVLEGGNHAQFGMYGPQSGDGQATITPDEQIELTVELILNHIKTDTN